VDEDEHLELGQLVARARVHAAPERQERAGTRRRRLHARVSTQIKDKTRYRYSVLDLR
jgi:hypothetical protein